MVFSLAPLVIMSTTRIAVSLLIFLPELGTANSSHSNDGSGFEYLGGDCDSSELDPRFLSLDKNLRRPLALASTLDGSLCFLGLSSTWIALTNICLNFPLLGISPSKISLIKPLSICSLTSESMLMVSGSNESIVPEFVPLQVLFPWPTTWLTANRTLNNINEYIFVFLFLYGAIRTK